MKRHLLLSAAALAAISSVAYVPPATPPGVRVNRIAGTPAPELLNPVQPVTDNFQTVCPGGLQGPQRAEAGYTTLTINIEDYDVAWDGDCNNTVALPLNDPENERAFANMISDNQLQFNWVKPGVTYDIVIIASAINRSIIYVKEGYTVGENDELTISFADATQEMDIHPLNPDGSEMVLQKVKDGEILQDGYATHQYIRDFFYRDFGQLSLVLGNIFRTYDRDGVSVTENNVAKVRATPTPGLCVTQADYCYRPDKGYVVTFNVLPEMRTQTVTSNLADYITLDDKAIRSPYEYVDCTGYNPVSNSVALRLVQHTDGLMRVNATMGSPWDEGVELSNRIEMCCPPSLINGHGLLVAPVFVEDHWSSIGNMVGTETPLAANVGGKLWRYPMPAHIEWNAVNDETGASVLPIGASNSQLAFEHDPAIEYGANSAPVFDCRWYDYGFNNPMFMISYMGRYGEIRDVDLLAAEIHYLRGGEELWTDFRDLDDFKYSDLAMENNRQEVDFTIISRNFTVDGMPGESRTRILHNEAAADFTAPTLSHLKYRNAATGAMTDRFGTPGEGKVEFYAGDFAHIEGPDWTVFQGNGVPSAVKTYYAPMGSDQWHELEVKEDASKDIFPGFGKYYCAALEGVDCQSANGWFDLRIQLSDPTGNSTEQVLSPAFKIASMVGVDDVRTESAVWVSGRNIMAPADASVYAMNGMPVSGRNVAPGIYIVRTGGKSVKVTVR